MVLVLLIVIGAMYFYLDSQLNRRNVLVDYPGRPAAGAGQNWLITGSDSRRGLTTAQKRQLHTGFDAVGHRSDTVLVLHIPSNGRAVLISLPRDSFVQIPGYGGNKLNAAFSFGGPRLLAKTVQHATGLRIDHYMQIGFGGLVNVVDAVGGVRMCLPGPINDPASGLNLKAGCQTLDGAEALGYVRTRHNFNEQDLQRVQDQRIFLRALLRKTTSPGTLLNPFAAVPAAFRHQRAHGGQRHAPVPADAGGARPAQPANHDRPHRQRELRDRCRGRGAVGLGQGKGAVQRPEPRPAGAQEPAVRLPPVRPITGSCTGGGRFR